MSQNWKDFVNWKFPYKGHVMSNPQYLKDKEKTFKKNGNGWWCNDGRGWEMDKETPAQKMRNQKDE